MRETLLHETLESYLAVAEALSKSVVNDWIQLNLSMVELKALLAVARRDGLNIGELAALLRLTRPGASRVADQLYLRGLITRQEDPGDRRRSLLGVRHDGQVLVAQLCHGDLQVLSSALARLQTTDLHSFLQGLRALTAVSS
jgi:DNA-binding MarR family transcriptional regulator